MTYRYFFLLTIAFGVLSCGNGEYDEAYIANPAHIHAAFQKYTDVIVYDIFSPPVASRNYAYASIAAYEVLAQKDSTYQSLVGQLRDLDNVPSAPEDTYSAGLATLEAFFHTAKHFIFSEQKLLDHRNDLYSQIKKNSGISGSVYNRSIEHGQSMASHIIQWSDGDLYKQTRTYPDFSITREPSKWKPTPPAYGKGIEPHWNKIRPMVLDSAQQFVPEPPTPFDTDEQSQFYKETMEVYEVVKNANKEEKEIASFWDCNPYVMNVVGHVMHATKKITPGGHWISIAAIASRIASADLTKSVQAYTLTSISLFDAFISCWDEKYRSALIRPETVINEHIDENWVPFLQTPPFPEHTSGHSVISRAAAVALTNIYGDNFAFDDDTEVAYGIPMRSFPSFIAASEEAAVSRLYGGIHYRPAIDYGVVQGEKVGQLIVDRLQWTEL